MRPPPAPPPSCGTARWPSRPRRWLPSAAAGSAARSAPAHARCSAAGSYHSVSRAKGSSRRSVSSSCGASSRLEACAPRSRADSPSLGSARVSSQFAYLAGQPARDHREHQQLAAPAEDRRRPHLAQRALQRAGDRRTGEGRHQPGHRAATGLAPGRPRLPAGVLRPSAGRPAAEPGESAVARACARRAARAPRPSCARGC